MASSPRARKRKSDEMDPTTPTQSPSKRQFTTKARKQALVDNLKLELNEKTRQLRATYALQCSDLRSRIERRINRVPISMRGVKMGDLMAQREQQRSPLRAPRVPPKSPLRSVAKPRLEERLLPALPSPTKLPSPTRNQAPHSQKMRKRKSSAVEIASDKENQEPDCTVAATDGSSSGSGSKRVKVNSTAALEAANKTVSRVVRKPVGAGTNANGILSPRTHNSRTLPQSPIKDKKLPPLVPAREGSPLRQESPTRPTSPSKLPSPFKAAVNGATLAFSAMAKRGYAAAGAAGARLTRPLSREKDPYPNTGAGLGQFAAASPTGKMLPPPRPGATTLSYANAGSTSIPNTSPQRTASQASMRSQASEQSTTSSNNTVIKKASRAVAPKKPAMLGRSATTRAPNVAMASKTRNKVVVSSSTTSTTSPKPATTRKPPVPTVKRAATTATTKKANAPTSATGRVLRKRVI